jgi:hypothetical protein
MKMISKRLLEKWRKESLKQLQEILDGSTKIIDKIGFTKELNERVLKLTQELLDQQLLNK